MSVKDDAAGNMVGKKENHNLLCFEGDPNMSILVGKIV